jgi:hypothetical protein
MLRLSSRPKVCNLVSLRTDYRVHSTAIMPPTDMTSGPDRSHSGPGFRVQPADDWSVLRTSRANVLITGPRDATHAFILAVTPYLQVPVRDGSAGTTIPSPPAAGTLILRDVDALGREQQQQLLRWLDDPKNGQSQVVSLTATPLYAHVRTGTFLNQLYYRLNVLYFEVLTE